jgi:HD superfamily phosphohydrolase YqeK
MEAWGGAWGLGTTDLLRWRAAGLLHDGLRDADPGMLRPLARPWLAELPLDLDGGTASDLLHGPAAASLLRDDGITDDSVLLAVAWHTLGHGALDRLGRALYLADYLEPGRRHEGAVSRERRARVVEDLEGVLREVAAERVCRSLRHARPLLAPTVAFWNDLVHG